MSTRPLKLHLRVFEIHRTTLRVVTLRPQCGVRFSSNYFHDTWHVLGGPDAIGVLARLLWGLAFQRLPGTLVLLDREHLVPTPFEADPPDPIAFVPAGLTRADPDLLRALRRRLRRPPPTSTIRWHTFGLPAAVARGDAADHRDLLRRGVYDRERMTRRGGLVCYTAPAELLRDTALVLARMSEGASIGYHFLAHRDRRADGEVQIIERFTRCVSAATVARREVLGDPDRAIATVAEREAIHRRRAEVLARGRIQADSSA